MQNRDLTTNDGPKLDWRTIGLGILLVIAGLIFLPRLFGNADDSGLDANSPEDRRIQEEMDGEIVLGEPVAATDVDRDGCAVNTTNAFDDSDSIWVVAENSNVTEGTTVFVRLYKDGEPVEDAPEITADSDYENTCINFVFEPAEGNFEEGQYEAQFFVNGNPGESVTFDVER
jgi:hypothetical protein